MKRKVGLIAVIVLLVAVIALASTFQGLFQTQPSGYTENPYTKPIQVQGDLAGGPTTQGGPFNYTYCGPECQGAAYVQSNNDHELLSQTEGSGATTSTTSTCTSDPFNCYVNSKQSSTCTTDPLSCYTATENPFGSETTCYYLGCPSTTTPTTTTCYYLGCPTTTANGGGQHTNAKIAVVLAAFKDVPPNRTRDDISNEWNTNVVSYYNAISHGKFDAHADVFGWYTVPNVESYYGKDCPGIPEVDCGIAQQGYDFSWTLARDGISIAEYQGLNLTQYEWVVVMHSGNGQESEGGPSSPYSNDVWSVTYYQGPPAGDSGKGVFTEYSVVPETERGAPNGFDPLGIWCAEFGHQLGFPDMFYPSEATGPAKTGHWELESVGAWNGNPPGSDPAYTLTINQENDGWLQGHFVEIYTQTAHGIGNGTATVLLSNVESNQGNMTILVVVQGEPQFYWIEARSQTGWDQGIPENGVIIVAQGHECRPSDASCSFIINADPADPTLNHAAWQVGMTYNNGFVKIAIESYSNGVYSINIT